MSAIYSLAAIAGWTLAVISVAVIIALPFVERGE